MPFPPQYSPRRLRPGDPLPASYPESWREFLRAASLTLGKHLRLVPSGGGGVLEADIGRCYPMWIRITSAYDSTHGGYSWEEVERVGGAWATTGQSGASSSDPAIEANGSTAVLSSEIAEARREPSGELIFQLEPCA